MRHRGVGQVYQRRGHWYITYRVEGKEWRQSVAQMLGLSPKAITEAMAKQALEAKLREVHQGRFVAPGQQRTTVGTLLDNLLDLYTAEEAKSLEALKSLLGRLKGELGTLRARQITPPFLNRLVTHWRQRYAAGTVEVRLAYLHRALTLGKQHHLLAEVPEFPSIKVSNARQGFVSTEQVEALCAAIGEGLADVVRFGYLTGCREREILGLEWAHVDFTARTFYLVDTKNRERRVLPLAGAIGVLLAARWTQRALGCPYVFHRHGQRIPPRTLVRRFKAAAVACGLPGQIFHDLRRSAIRNNIIHAMPESIVMAISGHKTHSVMKRYAILDTHALGEAMERVQQAMGGQIRGHGGGA